MVTDTVHIVFNPAAGGGKAREIYTRLNLVLCKRLGKNYVIHTTRKPREAWCYSRKALQNGAKLIVAVGGDGTINEVINGFYENNKLLNPNCELGILNCGTGQGLAKSLGMPKSLDDQLDIIFSRQSKAIDTGLVTYSDNTGKKSKRYFISECQIGIGSIVVACVDRQLKRLGGTIAYGITALKKSLCCPSFSMSVKCNSYNAGSENLIGIVIGNGNCCGGGMKLTPGAKLNDRLFDVLLIRDMNPLQRISNFMHIYSGTHISSSGFNYLTTDSLTVDSPGKAPLEADGELLGTTPCTIEIVPDQLKIRTSTDN